MRIRKMLLGAWLTWVLVSSLSVAGLAGVGHPVLGQRFLSSPEYVEIYNLNARVIATIDCVGQTSSSVMLGQKGKLSAGTYIFVFRDCRTRAVTWIFALAFHPPR
jgi:hypothetical protein